MSYALKSFQYKLRLDRPAPELHEESSPEVRPDFELKKVYVVIESQAFPLVKAAILQYFLILKTNPRRRYAALPLDRELGQHIV